MVLVKRQCITFPIETYKEVLTSNTNAALICSGEVKQIRYLTVISNNFQLRTNKTCHCRKWKTHVKFHFRPKEEDLLEIFPKT